MTHAPSSGAFEGREHVLPVRVYYEDTDFTGVVYHAAYLRYLERGRTEFLRSLGVHHSDLLGGESPTAFAVTAMSLRWLKPARVDDALMVRTTYDTPRGPRMTVAQRILRGDDVLLAAEVEAVCITPEGRPKRPPKVLVDAIRPMLLQEDEPRAPRTPFGSAERRAPPASGGTSR